MSRTWGPDETDVIAAELTACVLGQRGRHGQFSLRRDLLRGIASEAVLGTYQPRLPGSST
jgi:hypothetical protein